MKKNALCQGCLRPQPAGETNDGKCYACGGDTCFCKSCTITLAKLIIGIRDYKDLGLQAPILGWNRNDGVLT